MSDLIHLHAFGFVTQIYSPKILFAMMLNDHVRRIWCNSLTGATFIYWTLNNNDATSDKDNK